MKLFRYLGVGFFSFLLVVGIFACVSGYVISEANNPELFRSKIIEPTVEDMMVIIERDLTSYVMGQEMSIEEKNERLAEARTYLTSHMVQWFIPIPPLPLLYQMTGLFEAPALIGVPIFHPITTMIKTMGFVLITISTLGIVMLPISGRSKLKVIGASMVIAGLIGIVGATILGLYVHEVVQVFLLAGYAYCPEFVMIRNIIEHGISTIQSVIPINLMVLIIGAILFVTVYLIPTSTQPSS